MSKQLSRLEQLRKELAATGPDLTKQSTGGGDYAPPAIGVTRLRFVEYIELGVHTTKFKGANKTKPRAQFGFELSGPKHQPKVLDDGRVIPIIIRFKEVIGNTPKNGYAKLFKVMSKDTPNAKNFLDLIGQPYRGKVSHYVFKRQDGSEGTIAQLKKDGAYQIASTYFEDQESSELRQVKVDEAITDPKVFLWDYAEVEDFDALFIDGIYYDGGSKNKLQDTIRSAENFVGSPIYDALTAAGRYAELAVAPKQQAAEEDEDDGDDQPPVQEAPTKAQKAPAEPAAAKVEAPVAPTEKTAPVPAKAAAKPAAKAKPAPAAVEDDQADPLQGL